MYGCGGLLMGSTPPLPGPDPTSKPIHQSTTPAPPQTHTQALALALRDGAAAGSYRRLHVLRIGLDPDAFLAAITTTTTTTNTTAGGGGGADDGDQGEVGKEEGATPPKQQEEGHKAKAPDALTGQAAARTPTHPLLPLLACLRDGACPRLTTLDIDGRCTNSNITTTTAADTTNSDGNSSASPLTGEPLAALVAALRQGRLRRLEVIEGQMIRDVCV
jgi:hypothetical protein